MNLSESIVFCFAEERQLAIDKMSFGYLLFSFFEVIYRCTYISIFFLSSGAGIFCKTANLVFHVVVFHAERQVRD